MDLTLFTAAYESVAVIRCSPPSWMAHMVLEEKGLQYQLRPLSFREGEHRTPEMLARNPRGTIPVLEHDGVCVHETLAILEYLDFAFPEPPLLPLDLAGRARALTRLHEAETLKSAGMAVFAALMRGAPAEQVSAAGSAFEAELERWEGAAQELEAQAPSLAGVAVFAYLATAVSLGLAFDELPALARFYDSMRRRPAVAKTWPHTWTEAPPPAPRWRR